MTALVSLWVTGFWAMESRVSQSFIMSKESCRLPVFRVWISESDSSAVTVVVAAQILQICYE